MKTPFFSVIIPTYNRASFLTIAIRSVLEQSFTDFELLIVDDGSTDNTREIIDQFNKTLTTHRYTLTAINYIYQPHQGVSFARNRGIQEASAKYVCYLDSDDRFCQRKLEVTHNYIQKYPTFKIFHTEEIWYRNGTLLPHKKHHQKPDGYVFPKALNLCCVSISTSCIAKEVFTNIGTFDEQLEVCEDYDFWLRATASYHIKLIPHFLTIKEGGHPDQQSKKYPCLDTYRIYALKKLLDSNTIDKTQVKLASNELKKKCRIYIQGAEKRGKTAEVQYYSNLLKEYTAHVG